MPTISGYTEGREVYAENILSMTCTCVGGNPPATLTWWKGECEGVGGHPPATLTWWKGEWEGVGGNPPATLTWWKGECEGVGGNPPLLCSKVWGRGPNGKVNMRA